MVAIVTTSCGGVGGGGSPAPLSSLIVSPVAGYQTSSHDPATGAATGSQTITQVAGTSPGVLSALRRCGWVAGELQYWTHSGSDDVTVRVNEFSNAQGALCFQSSLNAQPVPSGVTRSTVPTFSDAWLSTHNSRPGFAEITFVSGAYMVQVVDSGSFFSAALVAGVGKKQQNLLS